MKNNWIQTAVLTIGLVLVSVILAGGYVYAQAQNQAIQEKKLKSEAVDGCLTTSSYTYTDAKSGVTTVEPIENTYKKCLELKGYSSLTL